MRTITEESIIRFEKELRYNEKAAATVKKYGSILRDFAGYLNGAELSKEKLMDYRDHLLESRKPQTVNGILTAIHSYLSYCGIDGMKVRLLKVQRQAFLDESRELSEAEYKRLLAAAQSNGNERLYLLMMTICGTGIRVSELVYITVEAAKHGRAQIRMKGKCRTIMIPKDLCKKLLAYAKDNNITEGHIFRTKSGRPLDRTNICHDMKKLCKDARVDSRKVFPHNLRHLFARTFYAIEKNLAHLADVLGHCRIETTRIYVAVSATAHERILNKMKLIV